MTAHDDSFKTRRRFLKLIGGSAVVAPLAGLSGCSGDSEAPPQSAAPASEPAASEPAATAEPQEPMAEPVAEAPAQAEPAADTSALPKLTDTDPQAVSLGYVGEASDVDTAKYPRYEPGQACSNCVLFLGAEGDEWGGCSIFPGKQVKATGWCSVYAPKG